MSNSASGGLMNLSAPHLLAIDSCVSFKWFWLFFGRLRVSSNIYARSFYFDTLEFNSFLVSLASLIEGYLLARVGPEAFDGIALVPGQQSVSFGDYLLQIAFDAGVKLDNVCVFLANLAVDWS